MGTELSKDKNNLKSTPNKSRSQFKGEEESNSKTIKKRMNLELYKEKQVCLIDEIAEVLNFMQLNFCVKLLSISKEGNEMKITETLLDKDINIILLTSNINNNVILSSVLKALVEIEKLGFHSANIKATDVFLDKYNRIYIDNLYKNHLPRKPSNYISIEEKIIEETHCEESLLIEELEIQLNEERDEALDKTLMQLMKDNDFYFKFYHTIDSDLKSYIDEKIHECSEINGSKEFNMHYKRTGYIAIEYILNKAISLNLIVKLILNSNNIADEGMIYLSEILKYIPHLSVLWLGDNKITSIGFIPFTKSLYNVKELKELNTNWNSVGDDGFISFCEYLYEIRDIEVLYVNNNYVTDKGIRSLCDSIGYISKLREIDVSKNKITYDGCNLLFDKLCECKNLDLISVVDNNIASKSKLRDKLQKNHPTNNLRIYI